MKKALYLLLLACFGFGTAFATGPDDILGNWVSSNGKGHIQVYKEGKSYFGKIIWLQEPNNEKGQPKLDANNPNPAQKNKPILGSLILRNFQFNDSEWNNGKIYDPMNGKEYKCIIKLKEPNTLNVRGYIGFSMLGRTEVWTRLK